MSDKRDEYVNQLKTKLDQWNTEIDVLEKKVDQVSTEGRQHFEKQLEEAKAHREQLKAKLTELTQAGDAAWEDIKTGVDLAWDAMTSAVRSAKSKFDR